MKKMIRHGISVGVERTGEQIYMRFKATGKLTHQDYEILTPMLDDAVAAVEHPEIMALVDITELDGWELRAAWDDFKLGVKHGREFTRIALVGNKPWEETATRVAGWFISGETAYFEDADKALDWLCDIEVSA